MGNSSHRFLDLFAIGSSEDRPDAQGANQGKLPIEIVVKADERHHTSVRNPGPTLIVGLLKRHCRRGL
jgi:hypothetical protein